MPRPLQSRPVQPQNANPAICSAIKMKKKNDEVSEAASVSELGLEFSESSEEEERQDDACV